MPDTLLVTADPIVLADIFLKPPDGQRSLLFGEPFGRSREVRQNKERRDSYNDGDGTFNDEQPPPS
jgi:hypothetical protein